MRDYSGIISESKTIASATTTNYTGITIPNGAARVVNVMLNITRTTGTLSTWSIQVSHNGTNYATVATDSTGYSASTTVNLKHEFPTGALLRVAVTTTGTVDIVAVADVAFGG